jgi:hypothetical protein
MKVQVLWVLPSERRFGSGDILSSEELAAFGVDAADLLAAGEAQIVPPERAAKAPMADKRKAK